MKKRCAAKLRDCSGMAALSGLVVLAVVCMAALYAYELSRINENSMAVFMRKTTVRNFCLSHVQKMIGRYGTDEVLWKKDCAAAQDVYSASHNKIMNVYSGTDAKGRAIESEARLLKYTGSVYILDVRTQMDDVATQARVYLEKQDGGGFIEQRWER